MMDNSVVNLDEIEPEGPGRNVRFVQRKLGVEAFRFDPETTRRPVAGPEGFAIVAIGARRGSYEPRGRF